MNQANVSIQKNVLIFRPWIFMAPYHLYRKMAHGLKPFLVFIGWLPVVESFSVKSFSVLFNFVLLIELERFRVITPVCWRRWVETATVLCDCSFVLSETQTSPDISLTQHTLTSLSAQCLSLASLRDEPRVRNLLSCS